MIYYHSPLFLASPQKNHHARRYQTARKTFSTWLNKRSLTSWTRKHRGGMAMNVFKEIAFRTTAKNSTFRLSGSFLATPTYFHIPATQTRYQCHQTTRYPLQPVHDYSKRAFKILHLHHHLASFTITFTITFTTIFTITNRHNRETRKSG